MIYPRSRCTTAVIQLNTDQYLKLKKCRSGKTCRWRPFNVWPLAEGSRWASVTFVLMSERRRCPYKARFRLPRGGKASSAELGARCLRRFLRGENKQEGETVGKQPRTFNVLKLYHSKQNRLPHNVQISLLSISSSLPASWTSWARPCSAPPPPSSPGR